MSRHWLIEDGAGDPQSRYWTEKESAADQARADGATVVEHVPADQLAGAVRLTDAERERMLWWLHKPVPPGPMKELDEAIIRKLNGGQPPHSARITTSRTDAQAVTCPRCGARPGQPCVGARLKPRVSMHRERHEAIKA